MYLINVLPIAYLPRSQNKSLLYFYSQKINPHCLIWASFGHRKIEGIVISSELIQSKIAIKKAEFQIKPLGKIINENKIITQQQLELFKWLSEYYFNPLPSLLKHGLPGIHILKKINLEDGLIVSRKNKTAVLFGDRFSILEKEVEKNLKNNGQVLFLFPNQIKLEFYLKNLPNLVEQIAIFEKKNSKKFLSLYQEINQGKWPIIFGKRSAIFAPFKNLSLIVIVDEENSGFETFETKIHYNAKTASLKLAQIFNADVILTTSSLSLSTYQKIKTKSYQTLNSIDEIKHFSKPVIYNISLKQNGVFSNETKEAIKETLQKNGSVLIFNNRRGHSPALICENCGYIFKCPNCDAALVYHQNEDHNFLMCHHCGYQIEAPDICPNCQGYLMKFIGFGNQKINEFFKNNFPSIKTAIFDTDHLKNINQEKGVFLKFQNKEINVLIATELFLKFLDESQKIDLVIIPLLEQMLVTPDFQSEERIKHLFDLLRAKTKNFIVQSLDAQNNLIDSIADPNFYERQLEIRHKTFYPPFSQIIKIQISESKPQKLLKLSDYAYELLNKNISKIFPQEKWQLSKPISPIVPKIQGLYLKEIYWRIEINEKKWPEIIKKRNAILKLLPDEIDVEIEPLTLF